MCKTEYAEGGAILHNPAQNRVDKIMKRVREMMVRCQNSPTAMRLIF